MIAAYAQRAALALTLSLALALRLWNLDQNGWGAEYYSAAVRSMAASLHNFLFAAFDPAGFISVDKPPLALWVQVASVKLFGFSPRSVLVPQAIAGTLSVWVLHRMVQPRFGALAGTMAALLLAIAPVSVAVSRTNNMDSVLVLVLLLAGACLLRATENGRLRTLLASMGLIGLAFDVKMLAAFIVLPAFFIVYLTCAPLTMRRRVAYLALAGLVLAGVALPWPLLVELTPPQHRPWVGGSRTNSVFELLAGYNGAGRFLNWKRFREGQANLAPTVSERAPDPQPDEPSPAPAAGVTTLPAVATTAPDSPTAPPVSRTALPASPTALPASATARHDSATARHDSIAARLFVRTPAGPARLADGQLAAQFAWFAPLALVALIPALRGAWRRRQPAPVRSALLFWALWTAICAAVYSAAAGIMHFYYTAALAPALAALAGIGIATLRDAYLARRRTGALAIAAVLLASAAWQLRLQSDALGWTPAFTLAHLDDWRGWLHATLAAGVLAGCVLLARAASRSTRDHRRALAGGLIGVAALVVVPVAWSLSTVLIAAQGTLPSADLRRLEPSPDLRDTRTLVSFGKLQDTRRLVDWLQRHRTGERYLLATTTAQLASPIIVSSGEAVIARGGFHGLDPALDVAMLARMVARRELRFVMIDDGSTVSRRMGRDAAQAPLTEWVHAHGVAVNPQLWRSRYRMGRMELWDLNPDAEFDGLL